MALNLKTNRNDSSSTPVPTDYISVDLTKDDEDAPVDLSCPGRHAKATPVLMEKENLDEETLKNLGIKTKEDLNKYISKLQAELRLEEVNLILLQKIRASHQKDHKLNPDSNGLHVDRQHFSYHQLQQNKQQQSSKMQNGTMAKKGSLSQIQQQAKYGGSSSSSGKGSGVYQHHSSQQSSRTTSATSHTSLRQQSLSSFQVNGASHNQQNPQQLQLQEQQRKLLQQQQAAAALVEQTASRRLAAAKMAVQKNLEKDLLRPPGLRSSPFDLSIVPNPSCPQFISLVGLEQAVNRLLTDESDVTSSIAGSKRPTSLSCARCSIDFTPRWVEKMDKSGSRVHWCEHCYRMEKKRSAGKLQEEKLNSAFAKAAQQERDMEKALAAELEAAKQQLDAIILPTTTSTAFRANPVIPGARNSPVPGPSRPTDKQPSKVSAAAPSSSQQASLQRHLQQKSSRSNQQLHNAKSILSSHIHQQPPLDLERLMLYNEKVGAMFKQLSSGGDQSSSSSLIFKERSSVKQNVGGARHAPYGRP